ncbi:MAG: DNA-binding response regulator [Micrococcales bacterium]
MAQLLVLSASTDSEVLPALALLSHRVRQMTAEPANLVSAPGHDLILLDARRDLVATKALAKILLTTGISAPMLLVVNEGGLPTINAEWGAADIILDTAGPGEIDARIRLAVGRAQANKTEGQIHASGVVIDEASYSAKVNGHPLDLTYKEFELLRFLAQHPGRVFTRDQLLSEVWGYDYFGGTRTVDVHIRRLRAKLGDLESLIGTVRNVGYRFSANDDANQFANA